MILSQGQILFILNQNFHLLFQESVEISLKTVHDIATENLGTLCVSQAYRPLKIPLNADRFEGTRQKADLAAVVLQDVGVNRHGGKTIYFYMCYFLYIVKWNNKLKA